MNEITTTAIFSSAYPVTDETHDPQRQSWVDSANSPDTDFPLQNLPFGVAPWNGQDTCVVAIGQQMLSLACAAVQDLLNGLAPAMLQACGAPMLNSLMALPPTDAKALRQRLSALLGVEVGSIERQRIADHCLQPRNEAVMRLPARICDYTDFLISRHHTERHGRFKGLKDPPPPAFLSLPVAYHGRASSICVSGVSVVRPHGQYRDGEGHIVFGPVRAMDYELEVGAFLRGGNPLGTPLTLDDAEAAIFGYCLLNDWSAKDVQWWEQVLVPFLGKNFHTSVSPWVVTSEALAPFRIAPPPRDADAPSLLPHLDSAQHRLRGGLAVALESWIVLQGQPQAAAVRLAQTGLANLSWTFGQMVAHHASNGCNLQPGDLAGSGTVSGMEDTAMACRQEAAGFGRRPAAHLARRWRRNHTTWPG